MKKFVSLLLTAVLLAATLTVFAVPASAEGAPKVNVVEEKTADYTKLEAAITSNTAKYTKPFIYTPDSFARFKAAYEAAKSANDAREITIDRQSEVDAIADALVNAVAKLVYAPYNYTEIYYAISNFDELNKADYTPASYAAVEAAIAAVPNNLTMAPEDVDRGGKALAAINNAVNSLVVAGPADYTAVNAVLAAAAALDSAEYTEESLSAVEDAIKKVTKGLNANHQGEVDAMAKAINNAINALVRKFDIAAYRNAKINEIKDVKNIPDENKETQDYKDIISYYETEINKAETEENIDSLTQKALMALNDFVPEIYEIVANGGATVTKTFDPAKSTKYEVVTVKIKDDNGIREDGKWFAYWVDGRGNIVSSYATYQFFAVEDRILTPVYEDPKEYDDARAMAVVTSNIARADVNANGTVTLFAEHSASKAAVGNAIKQHGIIYATDRSATSALFVGSKNVFVNVIYAETTNTALTGLFRTTVDPKGADKIYAVPFIIDANENTIYGEMKEFEVAMCSTNLLTPDTLEATLVQTEEVLPSEASVGSILSEGNIWIIAIIAVVVIAGVATLVIVKKKTKPATPDGESNK